MKSKMMKTIVTVFFLVQQIFPYPNQVFAAIATTEQTETTQSTVSANEANQANESQAQQEMNDPTASFFMESSALSEAEEIVIQEQTLELKAGWNLASTQVDDKRISLVTLRGFRTLVEFPNPKS